MLDSSKIGSNGLTGEFSMTGKLSSYPPFHTETLTVIVYTFECTAKTKTYSYEIGNEAMSILLTVKQAPDTAVDRELKFYAIKKLDGSIAINPAFLTLTNYYPAGD